MSSTSTKRRSSRLERPERVRRVTLDMDRVPSTDVGEEDPEPRQHVEESDPVLSLEPTAKATLDVVMLRCSWPGVVKLTGGVTGRKYEFEGGSPVPVDRRDLVSLRQKGRRQGKSILSEA